MSSLDLYSPPIREPKILDFDIENRPLSYLGNDYTTAEVTAIAWSWADSEDIYCTTMTLTSPVNYDRFVEFYDQADIVTGHYVRMHDLPVLNGALLDYGVPALSPKMVIDTKEDLIRCKGISKSQENLAAMLGLKEPKIHMSQEDWRQANRLLPEGIAETRRRVMGDVEQHKALRLELERRGMLRSPRLWKP